MSLIYIPIFYLFFFLGRQPSVILNTAKVTREAFVQKANDFAGRPEVFSCENFDFQCNYSNLEYLMKLIILSPDESGKIYQNLVCQVAADVEMSLCMRYFQKPISVIKLGIDVNMV